MNHDRDAPFLQQPDTHTVRRRIRNEALQAPIALIPAAATGVSAAITVFVAPFFGLFGAGLVATGLLGVITAIAFGRQIKSIGFKADEQLQELVQELQERHSAETRVRLAQQIKDIQAGFQRAGLQGRKGFQALKELQAEYDALAEYLDATAHVERNDALSIARLREAVRKSYAQGLDILQQAAALMAVNISDAQRDLRAQLQELQQQLSTQTNPAITSIKQQQMESHRQRLELLDQHELHIEQLLHASDTIEAGIQKTRLEIAQLTAGDIANSTNRLIDRLRDILHMASEVQKIIQKGAFDA